MSKHFVKPLPSKNKYIGPRTKKNPKDGKHIGVDEHGFDNYSDYFTDKSSGDQTGPVSFHNARSRKSIATLNGNATATSIPSFTVDPTHIINRRSSVYFRKCNESVPKNSANSNSNNLNDLDSNNHNSHSISSHSNNPNNHNSSSHNPDNHNPTSNSKNNSDKNNPNHSSSNNNTTNSNNNNTNSNNEINKNRNSSSGIRSSNHIMSTTNNNIIITSNHNNNNNDEGSKIINEKEEEDDGVDDANRDEISSVNHPVSNSHDNVVNIESTVHTSDTNTASLPTTRPRESDGIVNSIDGLSPIFPSSQLNKITSTPFTHKRRTSARRGILTFREENTFQQQQQHPQLSRESSSVERGAVSLVVAAAVVDDDDGGAVAVADDDDGGAVADDAEVAEVERQQLRQRQTPAIPSSSKSVRDPLVETVPRNTNQQQSIIPSRSNQSNKRKNKSRKSVAFTAESPPTAVAATTANKTPLPSFSSASILHYQEVAEPTPCPAVPEKRKIFMPDDTEEAGGKRRSKRKRVAPLQWYKSERVLYKWTPEGFEVDGIVPPINPSPKPDVKKIVSRLVKRSERKCRKPKKKDNKNHSDSYRLHPNNDSSNNKSLNPMELSAHVPITEPNSVVSMSSVIDVIDKNTRNIIPYDCFLRYRSDAMVNCRTKEPAQPDDPLVMLRGLMTPNYCAGILQIRPFQEKNLQFVKSDLMYFYIAYGKLQVTIHESTLILTSGDSFVVPPGNGYSIRNLRNDTALLSYMNIKNYEH